MIGSLLNIIQLNFKPKSCYHRNAGFNMSNCYHCFPSTVFWWYFAGIHHFWCYSCRTNQPLRILEYGHVRIPKKQVMRLQQLASPNSWDVYGCATYHIVCLSDLGGWRPSEKRETPWNGYISHLWKRKIIDSKLPFLRGYVSFRECNPIKLTVLAMWVNKVRIE